MKCEQCNKKLKQFSEKLEVQKRMVEKTMLKTENPLRYLELKAIYDCLKTTIIDLDDELEIY